MYISVSHHGPTFLCPPASLPQSAPLRYRHRQPRFLEQGECKLAAMPIALLVLALVLQTKPASEQHPATAANQETGDTKQKDSATHDGISPAADNVSNRHEQQNDAGEMNNDGEKQFLLGVVGVFGAWVGLGLLVWQNVLTRRSANAAKAGADAALLNAKAVIRSERPWIHVNINKTGDSKYAFEAINTGRTPAQDVSFGINETTEYKSIEEMPTNLLCRDWNTLAKGLLVTGDSFLVFEKEILPGELGLARSAGTILIVWGCVRYKDTISDTGEGPEQHESWFCFWFGPGGMKWVRGGPPEYNKHT